MNRKMMGILLALVIVLGGAGLLYSRLGASAESNQLSVKEDPGRPETPSDADTQTAADESADSDSRNAANEAAAAETEASAGTNAAGKERTKAPDFTVYDAEGKEVRLSDYLGKPVVLNFWASWCGPCQSEMPDFNEKYLAIGEDVQFLVVNMTDGERETVETASSFIAGKGYEFPVFFDTDMDAAAKYTVYSIPMTFFIDREGNGVAQATGAIDMATLELGISYITE